MNWSRRKSHRLLWSFAIITTLITIKDIQADKRLDPLQDDTLQAIHTAQAGFRDFLEEALTPYAKRMYGLGSGDSADTASLGDPVRLYLIDPDKVYRCENRLCGSVDDVSISIDTYLFPVEFNGKSKLLMSVDRYPGKQQYEIGSLGYHWLAAELNLIERKWPRREGFTMRLFKSNQAQVYAFSILQMDLANLTLIDPENMNTNRYDVIFSLYETLPDLQKRIATMLRPGGGR